jgi:hypothetical protein
MNALLSQINGVAIEHVLEGDKATLEGMRDAICNWIEFEIQKSQPHDVGGATAAAISVAIQKFIAAVHAAQRYAKAKQAVDASESKNKVEFDELQRKLRADKVLKGAEESRYYALLDELKKLDGDALKEQLACHNELVAIQGLIPSECKPAGGQWGHR